MHRKNNNFMPLLFQQSFQGKHIGTITATVVVEVVNNEHFHFRLLLPVLMNYPAARPQGIHNLQQF
jgi:hypothetical protein